MDAVSWVLIGIAFGYMLNLIEWSIVRFYPEWALSKKQKNQRVINQAAQVVRERNIAIWLLVDKDGRLTHRVSIPKG